MQNIYETFEFNKIRTLIAEFSRSELGKEKVLNLAKLPNKEEVEKENNKLEEMISLVSRFGNIPLSNSANILSLIEIAKKSGLFSPRDLSLIREDILTTERVGSYFKKIDTSYPLINDIVDRFYDLSSLEKEIKRVITSSLTVSDNASSKLKEIRSKLKALEESLNKKVTDVASKYSSFLSEVSVTIRDGHFVLPVKSVNKNKVSGIVYDISSSGNTTFIEPLEIVELNNEISSLKLEENIEIRRILKELTALVMLQENEVKNNNIVIGELDFLQSKSLYAINNEMQIGKLSKEQEIHLFDARHPLIEKEKVVANEYHLTKDKPIVIISGPNAGGKTVSLKVVGLLTLMFLSGLAIPVKEARISYFEHIYIDIGDNQSLSDNLSTFSAHMSQISEILQLVKSKDLVLLDELGTGTDPIEGEALALASIKYLETKNALCLISSHFNKVKEYALISDKVENSSLLFDEENLSPTYKYKYSLPGKSYGLEVASRYGIDKSIILEAKSIISKENNDATLIINQLIKKVSENEKIAKENELTRRRLEKQQKEIEVQKEAIKRNKATLLEDVKKQKEALLKDLEEEIRNIRKELNSENIKLHEVNEIAKKVDNLKDEVEEEIFNEDIAVNDYINIPSMNIYGKVKSINKDKALIITDEGLSLNISKNRLHKIVEPKNKRINKVNKDRSYLDKIDTSLKLELNIIGLHRDEAKEALIKYLDSCRIKNFKQVRIIHGFGSGTLRKMVHEYLKTQKDLSFRLGDINEGGGGATVVKFND